MTAPSEYRPSTPDRVGLWVFIIVGIGILVWSAYAAFMRIMELLLGEDARFLVTFPGTEVEVPLVSGGTELDRIVMMELSPFHFVIAAFVVAIIAHSYSVGARIQRDSDGLV